MQLFVLNKDIYFYPTTVFNFNQNYFYFVSNVCMTL